MSIDNNRLLLKIDTTIRELAHAPCIGEFHPLNGVDVDTEIPCVNLIGINTGDQSKIPCDHQTLYMMSVRVAKGLFHGKLKAFHAGVSIPKEARQGPVMLEEVMFDKVRH